jgi:hypothetical protein
MIIRLLIFCLLPYQLHIHTRRIQRYQANCLF